MGCVRGMNALPGSSGDVASYGFAFGTFLLRPRERLLTQAGKPVSLGNRAFEILLLLLGRPGETISKDEIFQTVWQGIHVGEGALRVHVSALRKALGEAVTGGGSLIVNQPGAGYSFTGQVRAFEGEQADFSPEPDGKDARTATRPLEWTDVPGRIAIGRAETIVQLSEQIGTRALVSIVGPGGVGKTMVALETAERVRAGFDQVCLVELAPLGEAGLVPTTVALALGLHLHRTDATDAVCRHRPGQRVLLILDSCEHVIENAALFVTRLLEQAPQFHILVTSREALRIPHERVHRLKPFPVPAPGEAEIAKITANPAVQLFAARATAISDSFTLSEANAAAIAAICGRLDGLPLAIELAVGQIEYLGVHGIASGLSDLFSLLARGRRTAAPRQQALKATLDWSYRLLTPREQEILRILALFAGSFSVASAADVAGADATGLDEIGDVIAGLAAKSVVSVDTNRHGVRYRLLDTTRSYGRLKLAEAGTLAIGERRHAEHIARMLADRLNLDARGVAEPLIANGEVIDDLRAALRWAYGPDGDFDLAITLTQGAAFVMLEMSLLREVRGWLEKALEHVRHIRPGEQEEFIVRLHMNRSSPKSGVSEENLAALLDMASRLPDRAHMVRLLDLIFVVRLRVADYQGALEVALRIDDLLRDLPTLQDSFCVPWMTGTARHFLGDHSGARRDLEQALLAGSTPARIRFSGHPRLYAHSFLARTLWLTGEEARAFQHAQAAQDMLMDIGQPMLICTALIWLCQLFLWDRNVTQAKVLQAQLADVASRYAMGSQRAMALGLEGMIRIQQGAIGEGLPMLAESLDQLERYEQTMLIPSLRAALAEGLSRDGRFAQAHAGIEAAIAQAESDRALLFLPELLKTKADILARDPSQAKAATDNAYRIARARAAADGTVAWARAIMPSPPSPRWTGRRPIRGAPRHHRPSPDLHGQQAARHNVPTLC